MTENQFKRLFQRLEPNQEHKDKLLQDMMNHMESETEGQRRPPFFRRVKLFMLTAAIMICLLTTTAFAASYLGLELKFLNFLNPANTEQQLYLENGAHIINQQVTNEHGTLEVKQIIGDSHLIYIVMDFTAPEGTILDAKRYRFHPSLKVDTTASYSAGIDFTLLDDENPKDNKISLVMSYLMSETRVAKGTVTLEVSDLEGADVFPDEYKTVIPGSWKTTFNMDYTNFSTTHQINQGISLYNYEAILSSISISPISITIKVDSAHAKEINEASSRHTQEISTNEYTDSYSITIHYKDGTKETTEIFNGMIQTTNNTITIVKPFTPVINEKEIESVEFFDVVVPLQK